MYQGEASESFQHNWAESIEEALKFWYVLLLSVLRLHPWLILVCFLSRVWNLFILRDLPISKLSDVEIRSARKAIEGMIFRLVFYDFSGFNIWQAELFQNFASIKFNSDRNTQNFRRINSWPDCFQMICYDHKRIFSISAVCHLLFNGTAFSCSSHLADAFFDSGLTINIDRKGEEINESFSLRTPRFRFAMRTIV